MTVGALDIRSCLLWFYFIFSLSFREDRHILAENWGVEKWNSKSCWEQQTPAITQRDIQMHLTWGVSLCPLCQPPAFVTLTVFIFEIQHSRHSRPQQTYVKCTKAGLRMNHDFYLWVQLGDCLPKIKTIKLNVTFALTTTAPFTRPFQGGNVAPLLRLALCIKPTTMELGGIVVPGSRCSNKAESTSVYMGEMAGWDADVTRRTSFASRRPACCLQSQLGRHHAGGVWFSLKK